MNLRTLAWLWLAILGGCASEQTPAEEMRRRAAPRPEPVEPVASARAGAAVNSAEDEMEVTGAGVLGQLREDSVQASLDMVAPDMVKCRERAEPKPPRYVGGKVTLRFRVGRQGEVKRVVLTESSVGHVGVERCVLAIAAKASFPRPRGGEAEAMYAIEIPPQSPFAVWPSEEGEQVFSRGRAALFSCRDGLTRPAPRKVTLYVGPGGKPTSVGVSSPEPMGDAFVDCLVTAVRGLKFRDPLGRPARMQVDLME